MYRPTTLGLFRCRSHLKKLAHFYVGFRFKVYGITRSYVIHVLATASRDVNDITYWVVTIRPRSSPTWQKIIYSELSIY